MRVIPGFVHAILDYLIGTFLVFAPDFLGFDDYGATASWLPRLIAIIIMVELIATDYELGFARTSSKTLSMETHLRIDYVLGTLLVTSPFLFGLSPHRSTATISIAMTGLVFLGVSLLTERHTHQKAAA